MGEGSLQLNNEIISAMNRNGINFRMFFMMILIVFDYLGASWQKVFELTSKLNNCFIKKSGMQSNDYTPL